MTLTLIVSDLHLGSGRDPHTGKHAPLDDFLADDAFVHWLAYYHDSAPQAHLVLNGDTFDLTQVVDLPPDEEAPALIGAPRFDRDRLRYGLGHSPRETCWKLSRVARGHAGFFAALGAWTAHGGRVHFVAGNHDPELRYPQVQQHLIDLITRVAATLSPDDVRERIHFHAWYYYRPDQGLYIEHGGHYEPLSYSGGQAMPICHFNNRYLFNRLEMRTPEADNTFPFSRYLLWLTSTDALATIAILIRQLPDMVRARRRGSDPLPAPAPANPRLPDEVEAGIAQVATESRRTIGRLSTRCGLVTLVGGALKLAAHLAPLAAVALALTGSLLPAALALIAWPLGHIIGNALINTHFHHSPLIEQDFMERVAGQLAPLLSAHAVRTLTFGHVHNPNQAPLAGEARYYNTGTWVPILTARPRLDVPGSVYAFLEVRGERARLLAWNDAAGRPQIPIIIDR